MALPKVENVKKCPYCGSDDGFTLKHSVSGYIHTHYSFDGTEMDNSEMYASLREKAHKYAVCLSCDKSIGTWSSESLQAVTERSKGYQFTR